MTDPELLDGRKVGGVAGAYAAMRDINRRATMTDRGEPDAAGPDAALREALLRMLNDSGSYPSMEAVRDAVIDLIADSEYWAEYRGVVKGRALAQPGPRETGLDAMVEELSADGWEDPASIVARHRPRLIDEVAAALKPCFVERYDCIHGQWDAVTGDHFTEHIRAALSLDEAQS